MCEDEQMTERLSTLDTAGRCLKFHDIAARGLQ
jgi:hypothetical protein